MKNIIEQTILLRKMMLSLVSELSDEQLLEIPEGANNNLLWNMAHLAVSQQILHYKLSGLEMNAPQKLIEGNQKGTSPADWTETPDRKEVEALFVSLPEKLLMDYQAGVFKTFTPYLTSTTVNLENIEQALSFNLFHEGIHFGSMLALKRSLTQ